MHECLLTSQKRNWKDNKVRTSIQFGGSILFLGLIRVVNLKVCLSERAIPTKLTHQRLRLIYFGVLEISQAAQHVRVTNRNCWLISVSPVAFNTFIILNREGDAQLVRFMDFLRLLFYSLSLKELQRKMSYNSSKITGIFQHNCKTLCKLEYKHRENQKCNFPFL